MTDASLAFVFPGQGSQSVGMLSSMAREHAVVTETFSEASAALGYDLWALVERGPEAQLNLTETTQPAILTASVALWRVWCSLSGARPGVMAGHSLGEFSALVCAGALDFADAVVLVRQRGRLMQSAVPIGEGAMAAVIGLDDQVINRVCAELAALGRGEVAAVNFNSPGQVVIAGHATVMAEAGDALKAAGAKRVVSLPVSAPFHTVLMKPAATGLAEALDAINITEPLIPVVHNVHAATESDPGRIRQLLIEQMYSPVQWTRCVATMADRGVRTLIECGPGRVLSGLNRRINSDLSSYPIEGPEDLAKAVAAVS